MRIILKNDFHNSSVTLNCGKVLSHIHSVSTAYLTVYQIRKAKSALCGIPDCTCSGDAGLRGPQQLDGKKLEVNLDAIYSQ